MEIVHYPAEILRQKTVPVTDFDPSVALLAQQMITAMIEGRGIGLVEKIRAYQLQDQGLDTVEANLHLGFAADLRKFDSAVEILSSLGIKSVRLMTNNPRKVDTLKSQGLQIEERVPVRSDVQAENERYLDTKARKLGHHIDWLG